MGSVLYIRMPNAQYHQRTFSNWYLVVVVYLHYSKQQQSKQDSKDTM